MGRHDEAQALYRQALAIKPDDPAIVNDLALSMLLAGHSPRRRRSWRRCGARSDVPPKVRAGIGVVLAASGDLAGARAMLGTSLADDQLLELSRAAGAAASH